MFSSPRTTTFNSIPNLLIGFRFSFASGLSILMTPHFLRLITRKVFLSSFHSMWIKSHLKEREKKFLFLLSSRWIMRRRKGDEIEWSTRWHMTLLSELVNSRKKMFFLNESGKKDSRARHIDNKSDERLECVAFQCKEKSIADCNEAKRERERKKGKQSKRIKTLESLVLSWFSGERKNESRWWNVVWGLVNFNC